MDKFVVLEALLIFRAWAEKQGVDLSGIPTHDELRAAELEKREEIRRAQKLIRDGKKKPLPPEPEQLQVEPERNEP